MPKNQQVRKYEVSYHIKGRPLPIITEIVEATCEAGVRVAIRYDHHGKGQGVVFVGKIKELPECAA